MVSSVLIANRGEIAVRIARTAHRMGLRTIAVYSDADAQALHVRACDEAYRIGPPPARESYLAIEALIALARRVAADCIHPGYGFLSENAEFAAACAAAGIVFIGPPPAAIRAMGSKDRAKALIAKAGVPVVPGYHGERQDAAFLEQKADELGYPVLIKAVAGGGGRGMRRVDAHSQFESALAGAMREADAAFGETRVLIEKYVAKPRHIEFQVFADRHGNVIHLHERDCSLQRRHQKVIEEAPAPGMTPELRAVMGRAAVEAARAVGYEGAGTVEFIADATRGLRQDGFWFMEMNTRLQVEHPVTEEVTGFDLVEWQFRVAAGEPLPCSQDAVPLDGHAVEARLYAEDPRRGFVPSIGKILALALPSGDGIRVDAGVALGDAMTRFYDPMIAKVIATAQSRAAALERLAAALERTVIAGVRSNAGFLAGLLRADEVRAGRHDAGFLERHLEVLAAAPRGLARQMAAAAALHLLGLGPPTAEAGSEPSPWDARDAFQLTGPREVTLPLDVDGETMMASVRYASGRPSVAVEREGPAGDAVVVGTADVAYVSWRGWQTVVRLKTIDPFDAAHLGEGGRVAAPMHGKVIEVLVAPGAAVRKGQRLAVIEAMKMEHALIAPMDGTVAELRAGAGDQVAEGAVLMTIEAAAEHGSRS